MGASLAVRNASVRRGLVRLGTLERLAERICEGEAVRGDVEISVLFCDDDDITLLNRRYRRKNAPTDVLSFEQDGPGEATGARTLGDIVISLETAERNCGGDRGLMRREIEMLFCHGLLHLLGYDHGTRAERTEMIQKQAQYLGTSELEAWQFGPKLAAPRRARNGGSRPLGRAK
jgi:probable rRNA maturation factor